MPENNTIFNGVSQDYFTEAVKKKFDFNKPDDVEKLEKYLKQLVKISKEELGLVKLNRVKKDDPDFSGEIELPRIELIEYFEKNLQNIGFISNKSRNYKANENIGKIYKSLIESNSKNIQMVANDIENKSVKEQDLYKPFKKILKKIFNIEKINLIKTANFGIQGKWINPDILMKYDDIYYSFEVKRWKDISPIAPHEARNHARHISNYPYVAINVPEDFFEFVIEYTNNFQIIKSDCAERGIGLILFDDDKLSSLKLLDAKYFTPDPIKKTAYEEAIKKGG
jgi:hypothetical protein